MSSNVGMEIFVWKHGVDVYGDISVCGYGDIRMKICCGCVWCYKYMWVWRYKYEGMGRMRMVIYVYLCMEILVWNYGVDVDGEDNRIKVWNYGMYVYGDISICGYGDIRMEVCTRFVCWIKCMLVLRY